MDKEAAVSGLPQGALQSLLLCQLLAKERNPAAKDSSNIIKTLFDGCPTSDSFYKHPIWRT